MAFTEFYCDASTGANINAGDKTANGVITSTNGAWSTVTNIFTATGGTPFSGVSVGDFAALYADGGTVAVYIARVTTITGGGLALTLSSTAKMGAAPTTAATAISCTTGGAWKGPNAASGFPFTLATIGSATNVAGNQPCINMKGGTNYAITAAVTSASAGPYAIEGYTSSVHDGGRATIDGGTSGASYALFTLSGNGAAIINMIFQNNGATGSAAGLVISGAFCFVKGCVVNSVLGHGLSSTGSGFSTIIETEVYGANQSNTASTAGFFSSANGVSFRRCIAHDNTGSNTSGLRMGGHCIVQNSIFDTNGAHGILVDSGISARITASEFYNNGGSGISNAGASIINFDVENCNFIKNAAWGILGTGGTSTAKMGQIVNCGFGSGTQVNVSGTVSACPNVPEYGSITYASNVTPWVDPANGDFRINLVAAEGTGRGAFTETAASYAGTIGYPDIGAAQHLQPAGGMTRSRTV